MDWIGFYDALAIYEEDDVLASGRPQPLDDADLDRIAEDITGKLCLTSGDSLLDAGAGTGILTRRIATVARSTVALDIAQAAIDRARMAAAGVDWLVAEPASLPFRPRTFTRVLCYGVVHRLTTHTELGALVSALATATAPGGIVLIGDVPERERARMWRTGERGRDENRTDWIGRLELREALLDEVREHEERYRRRLKDLGVSEVPPFPREHPGFLREVMERLCRETGGEVSFRLQPKRFPNHHSAVDIIIRMPA